MKSILVDIRRFTFNVRGTKRVKQAASMGHYLKNWQNYPRHSGAVGIFDRLSEADSDKTASYEFYVVFNFPAGFRPSGQVEPVFTPRFHSFIFDNIAG